MREYESAFELPVDVAESGWDPAFAVFVLSHARCHDELVEVRIGERLLVAWCPSCAALETFGSGRE